MIRGTRIEVPLRGGHRRCGVRPQCTVWVLSAGCVRVPWWWERAGMIPVALLWHCCGIDTVSGEGDDQ